MNYLNYTFADSEALVNTFDEVPLWSAAFGLMLLKHFNIKPNISLVDIGSGTGFPLLELAGRLGNNCKLVGIEPWLNANKRARQKIADYGYQHVEVLDCAAEQMPFSNNSVDMIVSNLGINNVEKPDCVMTECYRVLKAGGTMAITTNLNGHWKEFYTLFELSLQQCNKTEYLPALRNEQMHRGNLQRLTKLFTAAGFAIKQVHEDSFEMTFADGTAFLNHHFVKLGWLSSWINMFKPEDLEPIFKALEFNLNELAQNQGNLKLSVPMLYLEGIKK